MNRPGRSARVFRLSPYLCQPSARRLAFSFPPGFALAWLRIFSRLPVLFQPPNKTGNKCWVKPTLETGSFLFQRREFLGYTNGARSEIVEVRRDERELAELLEIVGGSHI